MVVEALCTMWRRISLQKCSSGLLLPHTHVRLRKHITEYSPQLMFAFGAESGIFQYAHCAERCRARKVASRRRSMASNAQSVSGHCVQYFVAFLRSGVRRGGCHPMRFLADGHMTSPVSAESSFCFWEVSLFGNCALDLCYAVSGLFPF